MPAWLAHFFAISFAGFAFRPALEASK